MRGTGTACAPTSPARGRRCHSTSPRSCPDPTDFRPDEPLTTGARMTTLSQALRTITADEIAGSRGILERAGLVTPTTHFSYVGLVEPDKRPLLAGEPGSGDRRVRSMLVDMATNVSHDVVVSIAEDRVVSSRQLDHAVDGQVPVVVDEFHVVEAIK